MFLWLGVNSSFVKDLNGTLSGFLPPAFSKKSQETGYLAFRGYMVPWFCGSVAPLIVGTLFAQLLLQFYTDCFETLQVFLSWSEDVHVVWM